MPLSKATFEGQIFEIGMAAAGISLSAHSPVAAAGAGASFTLGAYVNMLLSGSARRHIYWTAITFTPFSVNTARSFRLLLPISLQQIVCFFSFPFSSGVVYCIAIIVGSARACRHHEYPPSFQHYALFAATLHQQSTL